MSGLLRPDRHFAEKVRDPGSSIAAADIYHPLGEDRTFSDAIAPEGLSYTRMICGETLQFSVRDP
jgi:hypothetical protein